MNRSTPFACALAALAVPAAFAAAPAPTPLEPVVVTATRIPTPEADVLASVTVISREEIEATQARDLADLLSLRAGVEVARSGGPGQIASVFIRGGNSAHTLVLIDGVRVNPATSGAALNNIAPEMIERIEIVKGPRSTLYGSDALAGVINIITRGAEGPLTSAYLRGGRFETVSGGITHAVGSEDAHVAVSVSRDRTEGEPSFAGATTPVGQDLRTAALRGSVKVQGLTLSAQAWRAEGDGEYLDAQRIFDANFNVTGVSGYALKHQNTLNQTAAFAVGASPLKNWDVKLQLAHTTDTIRQQESSDFFRTQRPQLSLDNSISLGTHRIGVGAYAARDRVDSSSFGTAISDVRDTSSVYALDQFDYSRFHAVLGGAYTHADGFGSEPTYNAELGFDVLASTRLIASAGSGFHAPDAFDRFFPGFGNPDLKAERGKSYEVGVKHRFAPRHTVELRAFQNDVRQLINFDLSTFTAGNVDRARTQGVELAYALGLGHWDARLEGIIQEPKNCSADAAGNPLSPSDCGKGGQLTRRAKRGVTGGLSYGFTRGSLGLDLQGTSDRPDFDALSFSRVRNPGYGILNLSGSLKMPYSLSLAARVENVLDHRYQSVAGYNSPGTAGYVTLRYSK